MIKNTTILKWLLGGVSVLCMLTVSPLSYAINPVTVQAWAVHYGGNIQYNYRVTNNTRVRKIVSFDLGNSGDHTAEYVADPTIVANLKPELLSYPLGSYFGVASSIGNEPRLGGTFASPPGWSPSITHYEESDLFSIYWLASASSILPGQVYNFSVTVPGSSGGDPEGYLQGHFTAGFGYSPADLSEGPAWWNYTAPIVSLDTAPPVLKVTLSPATLTKAQRGKLMPITATVTVSDNYDPAPDIQLVSITANEVLSAGDVQGATLGTNDRSFSLMAAHKIKTTTARIYTITYSATDASGNRSLATATVSAL
ncbi:MAG: hypothetical protein ABL902_01585 [Gallionella sp.]